MLTFFPQVISMVEIFRSIVGFLSSIVNCFSPQAVTNAVEVHIVIGAINSALGEPESIANKTAHIESLLPLSFFTFTSFSDSFIS
jgi:hypothetical protein